MKVKRNSIVFAIGVIAIMMIIQSSQAIDFGKVEVVNYEPNESITLRLTIKNPLDEAIHVTDVAIPIPWGTDLIYGEISERPLYPTVVPHAEEGDDYTGGRGPLMRVEFIDVNLEPGEEKEFLLILKINDWKGHCPAGKTMYNFPYRVWMRTTEDVFFDYPSIIVENITETVIQTAPETFASYDEYGVVSLTPDIMDNEYGISGPDSIMFGKSTDITLKIFDGKESEVKNATVRLSGCGIYMEDDEYPYEFKGVTPDSVGRIRIYAEWREGNISMHAIDFISVTPLSNNPSSFKRIMNSMPVSGKPVMVNVSVEDDEGIDKVWIKYWEDGKPWRRYASMVQSGSEYSAYISPFEDGAKVNYQIVCIDKTGNRTESGIKQFTVSRYGVDLSVDSNNKSTTPNVNATYTITIRNIGVEDDTYNISIANIDNASIAHLSKYRVWLPAGGSETVLLNVTDEMYGKYRVDVIVISTNETDVFCYINTTTFVTKFTFDTGEGGYPSIMGIFNGTITPFHDVIAEKLYVYPCEGTGGHAEYVRIWNESWSVNGTWAGYGGDWHNISFKEPVVLEAGKTYNITIRTGSYPQIHHVKSLKLRDGWINCTEFIDVNGKKYYDWIPAIRLLD